MAISNRDRLGKGLETLRDGLFPFFEREMAEEYGTHWEAEAVMSLHPKERNDPSWDVANLLKALWDQWNMVFNQTLGHVERSWVSELRDVRNKWAHQETFSSDHAYRALDTMHRLLEAVSAEEAIEMDRQKQEVMRIKFEEERRREQRKAKTKELAVGQPSAGLPAWRDIVTPHPDVASGRYQQAEFAADLWQVHRGEAAEEYLDPVAFFGRTYITEGLRDLLVGAVHRLAGDERADPVIHLQTNFGGGKTHSLLALYHLWGSTPASELPGVEEVLKDVEVSRLDEVHRAVFVGNKISPGTSRLLNDGTEIRTMWGEIAWQLGGKEGFEFVAEDDRLATNPGDKLQELFKRYAPCVILVDEWVAYARQLHEGPDLPAGSFDTQFTFAQTLTESAAAVPGALVLVSVPESRIEVGGPKGQEALARLRHVVRRLGKEWRPASSEESFEIVRRRMFEPIDPENIAQRDAVIRAFSKFYESHEGDFPSGCREREYERRMKAAYPIHPELFERLYEDWSSLENFQRTRGVLRLMAYVIHDLWERNDANLLILPSMVPIDSASVHSELLRYLPDNWDPVVERDVDGPNSLPLRLDGENPALGRFAAARRVARTVFLGSAPTIKASNPGIDDRRIRLGCAQPGESPATFGDALRRLADQATHLYVNAGRYWFGMQPSVNRLAIDRAAQIDVHTANEEIERRLRSDRRKGKFGGVHTVPASGADVPDEEEVRLVVLGPEHPHISRTADSAARHQCEAILDNRGNRPRLFRNMVVFVAPDQKRFGDLEEAVRRFLAWKSIYEEREALNLDAFSTSQAQTKRQDADQTVDARMNETFIWLLIPSQPDPLKREIEWTETRLTGQDPVAERASRKMLNDATLMQECSAAQLRMEIDNHGLWRDQDHIAVKSLWDYFAQYLYLPRLANESVLLASIQQGASEMLWRETYSYAEAYDEEGSKYKGLRCGEPGAVYTKGLVVRPEVAERLCEETGDGGDGGNGDGGDGPPPPPPPKVTRSFYGSVEIEASRPVQPFSTITQEIIQRLLEVPRARVTVTIEVHAEFPEGVDDATERTVGENASTLKFKGWGFEKE